MVNCKKGGGKISLVRRGEGWKTRAQKGLKRWKKPPL